MSAERIRRLVEVLWPPAGPGAACELYAVLDAARDERIRATVLRFGSQQACLYEGVVPPELLEVAPYLVQLRLDDPASLALVERSWGRSWGIFIKAPVGLMALRKHLRTLLRVQDEAGERLYFRYYDPRVLRTYLPTCTDEELWLMFGPIRNYLVESEDGLAVCSYAPGCVGLDARVVALDSARASQGRSAC